jgi:hypothetical protein
MHRRRFVANCFAAGCAAGLASWDADADACLHTGKDYEPWRTTDQEAIVFWRKGREELILSLSYEANQTDETNEDSPNAKRPAEQGQALPADFAWVIPVPTAPDKYRVADAKLFELADQLAGKFQKPEPKQKFLGGIGAFGGGGGGFVVGGVEVVQQTRVGEYDITALKGHGPKAATEVNSWLASHNYLGIPVADMEFYTAKGWTFLAVKVAVGKAERGDLRPLHLSFASPRLVYPLKLAPPVGSYTLRAFLFTEGGIQPPAWLAERGLGIGTWHGGQYASAPIGQSHLRFDNAGYQNPLASLWTRVETGPLGRFQRPFFTVIGGEVNTAKAPISEWTTDFELSTRG